MASMYAGREVPMLRLCNSERLKLWADAVCTLTMASNNASEVRVASLGEPRISTATIGVMLNTNKTVETIAANGLCNNNTLRRSARCQQFVAAVNSAAELLYAFSNIRKHQLNR